MTWAQVDYVPIERLSIEGKHLVSDLEASGFCWAAGKDFSYARCMHKLESGVGQRKGVNERGDTTDHNGNAVQNVFIKLFRHWTQGMRPSKQLRSWLYRVTHNEAVDHVRRDVRHRTLHEKAAQEQKENCPDGHNCPDTREDQKAMVLEYLRKLHPREQQVILLRLEEGMSYAEIAEITGRTEGNVGNILHHAVKKLAQASVDEVRLGQSATNMMSYVLWFHRTQLVVASNLWSALLPKLRSADKEWLEANSFYVYVSGPLHV